MSTTRLNQLDNAPISRLLLQYSIPSVVGMVVMQLYNIIDRIFIGQVVGSDAIAGLAITFPVMNISAALGVLIGAGAATRVSIALGAQNQTLARHITGNALTFTIVIGIIYVSLLGIFIDPILQLFGATPETLPYARDMMLYILPGLLLTNIAFSFNNIMRASGFPVKAMVTMFIGAVINIILAPIFIYFLRWGIKGAAIATDIAMTISAAFVMWHFIKPHGEVHFQRHTYAPDTKIILGIISIGAAPSIVNIASCFINVLINRALGQYGGSDAIASAGVFVTVTAFVVCIILGICQGMQPIIGYNYGARNISRVKQTFWQTTIIATIICSIGCIIGETIPHHLASAFINAKEQPELIAKTARFLRIAMPMFWTVGLQVVATTFFQSIDRPGKSIFLSLTRQVIFLIPCLIILPPIYGLNGIWISFPSSDIVAFLVTTGMVFYQLRHLKS